jgi:hypothetical protein
MHRAGVRGQSPQRMRAGVRGQSPQRAGVRGQSPQSLEVYLPRVFFVTTRSFLHSFRVKNKTTIYRALAGCGCIGVYNHRFSYRIYDSTIGQIFNSVIFFGFIIPDFINLLSMVSWIHFFLETIFPNLLIIKSCLCKTPEV